jgi:O-antigen ligase
MRTVSNSIAMDALGRTERRGPAGMPGVETPERFEHVGLLAIFGVAGALQFSIALAQTFLALAILCWVAMLVARRERFSAPAYFWPLAVYAGLTLVSAAFSFDPRASLVDSKQLLLFLLVPVVYRFVSGTRGFTLMTVVVTCAAASAAIGIFQYGILHFDHLGQRPQGTLSHWMTYSGLLMLVFAVALARVLFGRGERTWAALVIPALVVAVAVTFTRGAMIGVCAAAAVLFALKDFRLFAIAPLVAAVFVAVAPGQISERFASIFDRKNPTNRDRVAMLGEGERMIRAHPLTGVGPNMVQRLYTEYRGADAVNQINPHLHNVPLQIAAERGLPALAAWLWFMAALIRDAWRRFGRADVRFLPAAALSVIAALLVAGMFEYNFGDSEVLMLFLIVTTLPAASERTAAA